MERFKRSGEPSLDVPGLTSHSRLRTTPAHGRNTARYESVREVMLAHLSFTLVDATLERALRTRNLTPDTMTSTELAELASDAMVGLRLFVPEQQLARLMLDLAEVLGQP